MKQVHERVEFVKTDKRMEVEYMTLFERDQRNIELGEKRGMELGTKQGMELGKSEERTLIKKVFKLSAAGYSVERIASECNVSASEIEDILSV